MAIGAMTVLVVLEKGASPARVFGRRGAPRDACSLISWSQLREMPIRGRDVGAVLFQAEGRGDPRPERLALLRRLGPGVPLIPFLLARGSRARASRAEGATSTMLHAPIDPTVVTMILERERLIAELRQKARRTLARSRDQQARLHALAAVVR